MPPDMAFISLLGCLQDTILDFLLDFLNLQCLRGKQLPRCTPVWSVALEYWKKMKPLVVTAVAGGSIELVDQVNKEILLFLCLC